MPTLPKPILKPSAVAVNAPQQPTSREEHNLQVALHHARLLQDRKDVESRILLSTEELLDLPSSPDASPAYPSSADAATVCEALQPFQLADYDALIQERNINHCCGYVLCSKKNQGQNPKGKYRIVTGEKTDFRVVETKELEKWCSNDCGRRALYLRVQLSDTPAWARENVTGQRLRLYDEGNDHTGATHYGDNLALQASSSLPDAKTMEKAKRDLAIERGGKVQASIARPKVAIRIKEKAQGDRAPPAPPSAQNNGGGSVEGYRPSGTNDMGRSFCKEQDSGDLMRTIG
ncbi:MAG: hypothetical protein Q9183_000635 [Haloplaca sp. 2 TL-2023]